LTASFATRGSRVQIPSAPPISPWSRRCRRGRTVAAWHASGTFRTNRPRPSAPLVPQVRGVNVRMAAFAEPAIPRLIRNARNAK
jgi:hypothetical protein